MSMLFCAWPSPARLFACPSGPAHAEIVTLKAQLAGAKKVPPNNTQGHECAARQKSF